MKLELENLHFPIDILKGKTIVITGAGSGIGRQTAKSLSNCGANLILLSKDQAKLESLYDEINSDNSRNISIQPIDFEKVQEREFVKISEAIKEEHSIVDGLINNAGILGEKKPLEQYNFSSWSNVLQVNLNASFLITKNLIPLLKKSSNGSILFTSSGVGRKGRAYWGAYSISKFATEGMMQIFSEELQNTSNIRVNCINPGPVRTKMRELAYPAEKPEVNPLALEIMQHYLYLMSDLSVGINGQSIDAQER